MKYFDLGIFGRASVLELMDRKTIVVMTVHGDYLHYSMNEFIDCFRDKGGRRLLEPQLVVGATFEVKKVKKSFYAVEKVNEGYKISSDKRMIQVVSDQCFYRYFRMEMGEPIRPFRAEDVGNVHINNQVEIWVYMKTGMGIMQELVVFNIRDMVFKAMVGSMVVAEFEIGERFPTIGKLLGTFTGVLEGDRVKVLAYDVISKETRVGYLMNKDGTAKALNS